MKRGKPQTIIFLGGKRAVFCWCQGLFLLPLMMNEGNALQQTSSTQVKKKYQN